MTTAPNEDQVLEDLVAIEAPKVTKIAGEQTGERTPFTLPECCKGDCVHAPEPTLDPATGQPDESLPLDRVTRNRILWVARPKNMLLLMLAARVLNAEADPDAKLPLFRAFMDTAMDEKDSDIIWARLGDSTDELDTIHVDALISTFMGRWMPGRPTGPLSGQPALQRETGRPSTGRARSTARTRRS